MEESELNTSPGNGSEQHEGRLLVVDDEQLVRKALSRYLAKKGYSVEVAEDGIQAIDKLSQDPFDLVLTDLKMPNLDGRELMTIMAQKFPDIPKIVLTGFGTNEDILLALKTGAYDFITKPIMDFDILHHAVERALERRRLATEKNRYMEQQRRVNDVTAMLNRGKKTEEIFKMLNTTLKEIIPFNKLTLALIEEATRMVVSKLVESDQTVILGVGERFPISESSLKEVARDKDVLRIDDLEEYIGAHPGSRTTRVLIEEGMRSSLVLPLIINNITRGFLIFNSVEKAAFTNEHALFLKLISGQIAFSIQRGELLEQLELHTKNLEHLVKVRTHEILKTQKTTIFALSKLAEVRDPETGQHLERIRNYSVLIAQILKYSGHETEITNLYLRDLYDSSILHDIGKVGIPDSVLLKPGVLTVDEFEIIKTHTTIGYNALKSASRDLGENSFLKMAMDVTLYHHEQWNGQGYPEGLKGADIPLAARIVTIADIYDALGSRRPYKEPFPHDQCVDIMKHESYRFDPLLFKIFLDNTEEFHRIHKEFS
ncbi:MAG: response regulator [Spirochaetes bacterium]|nr:MAG: response regulator [Spirochaetota bacterium]